MKKLYALITCPLPQTYGAKVIQVSFNREELEEIAKYLNQIPYFSPNARVDEVDQSVCEYDWPTK